VYIFHAFVDYFTSRTKKNSGMAAPKSAQPLHKTFETFLSERRYETGNLPGNLPYKSSTIEKGRMIKVPPAVTLTHQPYRHVDHLEFMNVPEIQDFVRNWQVNLHMVNQRSGIMYGYYIEDPNYEGGYRAVVEGIYEPPQECIDDSPVMDTNDSFQPVVDKIAESLGLERIGFIFTSLGRDSEHLMTSKEVVRAAKMQIENETNAHYTKYVLSKFVTCVTHPNLKDGAQPETNVFMVSDQFCGMVRDRLIETNEKEQTNPKRVKLRKPLPGELQPEVLEAGKNANTEFDPDWFVVKINSGAPVRPKSFFVHSHFPRENRPGAPQLRSDIKRYLSKCRPSDPIWSKLSDFHLLLFLARIFDVDTAKVICDAVRERGSIDDDLFDVIQAAGNS
jgi:nuclear protein localization family protein 4